MADYLGLLWIVTIAANVWAFLAVLDARPGPARLLVWGAALLVPVLGWIAWFLIGPRPAR